MLSSSFFNLQKFWPNLMIFAILTNELVYQHLSHLRFSTRSACIKIDIPIQIQ